MSHTLLHARIQDFISRGGGGGGVQARLPDISLHLFCFFSLQLILQFTEGGHPMVL